jgi:hypothetical protein
MAGRNRILSEIRAPHSAQLHAFFLWREDVGSLGKSALAQSAQLHAAHGQIVKERYKPTEKSSASTITGGAAQNDVRKRSYFRLTRLANQNRRKNSGLRRFSARAALRGLQWASVRKE